MYLQDLTDKITELIEAYTDYAMKPARDELGAINAHVSRLIGMSLDSNLHRTVIRDELIELGDEINALINAHLL